MTEPKFTPGPWRIVETVNPSMVSDYHIKIGDDQIHIFPYKRIYSEYGTQSELVYDEEKIANAHLMAGAPDLYEALEKLLRTLNWDIEVKEKNWWFEVRAEAKNALAKARGESHD